MKPEMIPVVSSTLKAIGWADDKLYVSFLSGHNGHYDNVPHALFDLLLSIEQANKGKGEKPAVSLGRAFHYTIKTNPEKYPGHKDKTK